MFVGVAGLVVGLALILDGSSSRAEEWTSLETNQTIQGTFLGMWQDKVVLRLTNGRRVVVAKAQLAAASRLQADELAAEKEEARAKRIAELSQSSAPVASIAATPAAPYVPVTQQAGLKESIEAIAKQLEAGHIRALWDAMPPKYQRDVQEFVRLANQSQSDQQYLASQRLAAQLGRTLIAQREFVFNYPAMASLPPQAMEWVEKLYGPAAGIITVFGDPEVISLEAIRSDDWEPMIAALDEAMAPHLAALVRTVPVEYNPLASLTDLSDSAVQMTNENAGTVTITGPQGQPSAQAFVRVDGKWLPEDMVSGWDAALAEARNQAAQQNNQQTAMASMAAISMIGAALGNIESAETQEEFNATIDMYVDTVKGLIGSQMAAGQPPAGPGFGGSGFGQSGPGAPMIDSGGMLNSGGAASGATDGPPPLPGGKGGGGAPGLK
jgi:hypothetical protein